MRAPKILLWLMIPPIAIEVLLILADQGLIGSARWRGLAYQNGAFWVGLLGDWRANYTVQPVTMFVTYAFLHSGLGHLVGNMLSLWLLGRGLLNRIGAGYLLAAYGLSAIGGAAGHGLLNTSAVPMVGASGAIFGLAGVWLQMETALRRRRSLTMGPIWRSLAGLVVINILLYIVMEGRLAWQAHLGGFVTGWLVAMVIGARPKQPRTI